MDIDWTRIFTHLISVTVAYVLALPVAWAREKGVRGAILKDRGSVHGTTTASGIWNIGTIGAATAFNATRLRSFKRDQLCGVTTVNSAQAKREIIDLREAFLKTRFHFVPLLHRGET